MGGFEYKRAFTATGIFIVLFLFLDFLLWKFFVWYAVSFGEPTFNAMVGEFNLFGMVLMIGALILSILGASQFYFLRGSSIYNPTGITSGGILGILYFFVFYTYLIFFEYVRPAFEDVFVLLGIVSVSAITGYILGRRE